MLPERLRAKAVSKYYGAISRFRPRDRANVAFVPSVPATQDYSIVKVCAVLGYSLAPVANDRTRLCVSWHEGAAVPPASGHSIRVLNAHCGDVSRRRVQQAFAEAFRYALTVDPLTYGGPVLEKADHGSSRSRRVLICPILRTEPGKVYERLIDNVIEGQVEDICIAIVGKSLPVAYRKRRPKQDRFSNTIGNVILVGVEDVTTPDERDRLLRMAADLGLDWGEVGTLRDTATGALYVCGVDRAPRGPPETLGFFDQLRAVRMLAQAFKSQFLG
jgi:hypothetical protein